MRKKNGFTLVELLSTVVILGVVLSVTVYIVMKNINKAKDNADLITYNNIKSAAKVYNDEVASYWNIKDDYEYSCISLGNMIEIGYFDENTINKSDKLSKDTMLKVIRDKDSKVIKETSFSFEDSILPDVDCGYQSSVSISTDYKGNKVKKVNAKILYNILNSDYYRYFYVSGFSENTITANDVVYACESIGNCGNDVVSNLKSGHWYLANSDVIRLNVESNGTILAYVNYNSENIAESSKTIDAEFDNTPPVITLKVYKIGSYDGNNPKTKGEPLTIVSGNYSESVWKNYGYWFDISTNEDTVIKWTYNNAGSTNSGNPSNNGANCNTSCSKTLSGDGSRKAIVEAIDEAGNSSKVEINVSIDRTAPTISVSEQRCSNKDNCLGSLIGNKIEKSTNTSISIDDKNWSYNSFNIKYNASDSMSDIKEIRILQNSSGIYNQLNTNMVSNNIVSNNSNLTISDTGQRYIQIIAYDNVGNSSVVYVTGYISNVITVNYNANGGSGAPASQDKYNTVDLTLSSTKPTRTGYTFVNWNTKSDGSGTSYHPGSKYTANESATLYAIWKANTYSISYNLNGGSKGSSAPTSGTYGSTVTVSNPTRTNYTFTGWTVSGTGASMNGTNLTIGLGNITLTANWKANDTTPPTCSLSANGSNITAAASDDKGIAYQGWSSSYSGNNSTSKSIASGTHTYYVKDTAGNTNTCSISIKATYSYQKEVQTETSAYERWTATGTCYCRGKSVRGGYPVQPGTCTLSGCSCLSGMWTLSSSCSKYHSGYYCTSGSLSGSRCIHTSYVTKYDCDSGYTKINNSWCYKK